MWYETGSRATTGLDDCCACGSLDQSLVPDSFSGETERTAGCPGWQGIPKQTYWQRLGRKGQGTLFDLAKGWIQAVGTYLYANSFTKNTFISREIAASKTRLPQNSHSFNTLNQYSRSPNLDLWRIVHIICLPTTTNPEASQTKCVRPSFPASRLRLWP